MKMDKIKCEIICDKNDVERDNLTKRYNKLTEQTVAKSLSEDETDISVHDLEVHNTSQSSFNSIDNTNTPKKVYVNFDEIENFDLFLEEKPSITCIKDKKKEVLIDNESNQTSSKKIDSQPLMNSNDLKFAYLSEGSPTNRLKKKSSKLSLSQFESTYDKIKFVEITENRAGNYNRYVSKVFETMKGFNKIDFAPLIEEKSQYLGPNNQKYTLLIDLDETLIHSDFNNVYEGECDHLLHFTHENEEITIPLFVRPGLMDFLTFCQQHFEVCIFTASRKEYADCILNFLDPANQIFKYRFYRDDCISIKGKIFIKDMNIFKNRYPEYMLMIDNSLYSFANQLSNGILITSFYNNKKDKELSNLQKYLKSIIEMDKDVRKVNEKVFNFEHIRNQILTD
jgi:CTD small phosphatase-like protein 2